MSLEGVTTQQLLDFFIQSNNTLLNKGFYRIGESLYMEGISISIPQVLADKFIEADEEEFLKLKNFWAWLSLNPNSRCRENAYDWIQKHGIQLTPGGMMILYRRVISLGDAELTKFVSQEYLKRKKNKKSTSEFVYKYPVGYGFESAENSSFVGILKELYNNPSKQQFTDAHTKSEDYRIGKESRMVRINGDESNAECSSGYHASHKDYSFGGFGDTPIVVVVNPMDLLNIVENAEKVRTCAFTPIAVLDKDAEWADDPKCLDMIDEHLDGQVERLQELINNSQFEDFNKHEVFKNSYELGVGMETVLNILNS